MAKLYFYYSAMNAGKTTTLLQSAYNYRERGMGAFVLKPRIDDRYGDRVHSRIGLETTAVNFNPEQNLLELTDARLAEEPLHCVLVDEAQDVRGLYVRLLRVLGLVTERKILVVAGDRKQLVYTFDPKTRRRRT